MKKLNVRKSIIMVILLAVVLLFASNVYATGTVSPINIPTTTQQTNDLIPMNTKNNINSTNNINNTNVVAPTTNATMNTQVSTYTNTNLPQTGDASDYAVFLLIATSIVIAIFAYKKVRDYNI